MSTCAVHLVNLNKSDARAWSNCNIAILTGDLMLSFLNQYLTEVN